MENDDREFAKRCEELINQYNLADGKRIGFMGGGNIGEIYFVLSALPAIKANTGIDFVIFTYKNCMTEQLIKLFNNNGITLNYERLNYNLELLYSKVSDNCKSKYDNVLCSVIYLRKIKMISQWYCSREIKRKLVHPKYIESESKQYLESLNISPGRTVFFIPDARWITRFPDVFWKSAIKFYQLLGYSILVNSRTDMGFGEDVRYIYPPIEHVVPLANLCGHVFGIRTGLTEIIALETTARVIIVGMPHRLVWSYPFLDESKITYLNTSSLRSYGLACMDDAFNLINNNLEQRIAITVNISASKIILREKWKTASVCSNKAKWFVAYFQKINEWDKADPDDFCSALYRQSVHSDTLFLEWRIEPPLAYENYVALVDAKLEKPVLEFKNIRDDAVALQAPYSGEYYVFVKLFHPHTGSYAYFETDHVHIDLPWACQLRACVNYEAYLHLLAQYKEKALIIIASHDTPTNGPANKKLFLDALGLQKGQQAAFRNTYIAVLDKGTAVYENYSADLRQTYIHAHAGMEAAINSGAYCQERACSFSTSIKLNHLEYALNMRGLNFVVWDLENNKLADAVAFDTYLPENRPARFKDSFYTQAAKQPDAVLSETQGGEDGNVA